VPARTEIHVFIIWGEDAALQKDSEAKIGGSVPWDKTLGKTADEVGNHSFFGKGGETCTIRGNEAVVKNKM